MRATSGGINFSIREYRTDRLSVVSRLAAKRRAQLSVSSEAYCDVDQYADGIRRCAAQVDNELELTTGFRSVLDGHSERRKRNQRTERGLNELTTDPWPRKA